VLTSILPSDFHHPEILPPSAVPTETEEGTYTGIYSIIVATVSLSGGSLNDSKLERYMKRLRLDDATPVEGYEKPALLLKRMEREGYLVRVKETGPGGEEDVTWFLGPRAKVEIGDDGVRGLTKVVYNQPEGDEAVELERKIARSLGVGERPEEIRRQAAAAAAVEGGAEQKRRRRTRNNIDEDAEEDDAESDDE
jgi:hypothetical protein